MLHISRLHPLVPQWKLIFLLRSGKVPMAQRLWLLYHHLETGWLQHMVTCCTAPNLQYPFSWYDHQLLCQVHWLGETQKISTQWANLQLCWSLVIHLRWPFPKQCNHFSPILSRIWDPICHQTYVSSATEAFDTNLSCFLLRLPHFWASWPIGVRLNSCWSDWQGLSQEVKTTLHRVWEPIFPLEIL